MPMGLAIILPWKSIPGGTLHHLFHKTAKYDATFKRSSSSSGGVQAKRLFAINFKPQKPELQKGELLLLQLVKNEANRYGKLHGRIEFALEFDHFEEDRDGSISRKHWPSERRRWRWIVHCSSIKHVAPF